MTDHPLLIDSFAGGGGASTAIEMALGVSPDYAINHDAAALALHAANHPETEHLQSSIYAVDPRDIVGTGQRVGLAWFSPDCKHFSKARGGTPVNRNIRDLAWVVVHWAERVRPEVIALENVVEFETWAPLRQKRDGEGRPLFHRCGTPCMEPDPQRKGETFRLWVRRLRKLGYEVQWRTLRACDYGAATIRKRLFLIARCDGRPIVWPEPTHGDPGKADVRAGKLHPWRTAAECIDWSLPCPSIFDSSEDIRTRLGLCAKRPLTDNTLARIARGMKRHVLNTSRPFVVTPAMAGSGGARPDNPGKPDPGEIPVTASSIIRHFGASSGQRCDGPAPVTPAGGGGKSGLITPYLMSLKGRDRRDSAITAPHPAVLAGGGHSVVAAPLLVQSGYGERKGQAPRSLDPFAPLGTIVAGGIKHAPAMAFLAQHNKARNGVNPGRAVDQPISTLTATGSHQTIVTAWVAQHRGDGAGQDLRHGVARDGIPARDGSSPASSGLAAPEFAPDHEARARQVAEFLRRHGAWDGGDFVTLDIAGRRFLVVDIGMRMLTPRELFTAQGFPSDYVIEGVWEDRDGDWIWTPFSKAVQVRCCGNSVSPWPACALIEANCGHLVEELREKAA